MILHRHKIIFIHIPKTGGTSIEKLFGVSPFNPIEPNYEYLVGWCPVRKFYMQHATPRELIETNLISPEIFKEYTKIAIVRNTYSRLVSDYFWHQNLIKEKGNFLKYLLNFRPFKQRNCKSKGTPLDYSSHIKSQLDYLSINGRIVIDEVFDFEKIGEIIKHLSQKYNIKIDQNLHEKKGKYKTSYKSYYNLFSKLIVKIKYRKEINYFDFKF